jgi:hypothetical protein
MSIRTYLQSRRLRKDDLSMVRQKKIRNLSEIRSVFCLVSINSMSEYDKWERLFSNMVRKNVELEWVAYLKLSKKNQNPNIPHNVLTHKDVNYWGFPKQNQFLKGKYSKTYDLSIDLNFENVFLLNWLWVQIDSNLRVGSPLKEKMLSYYDLAFKTKDPKQQPKLFVDQVFYFLDNINK